MSKYEILITEKLKDRSIRSLFRVIDAFQSYEGDWSIILMPKEVAEGDIGESGLDKATPIPATHGAVLFPDFIVNEDKLAEVAGLSIGERRTIESGTPLWLVLRESKLESILERYPELIEEASFEVFLPLKDNSEITVSKGSFPYLERIEVFETDIQLLDPKVVSKILEEVNYVGEYLEKLEKAFSEEAVEEKAKVLAIRGICPASIALSRLESYIRKLVEEKKCFKEGTMMFARIYIREAWSP